VLALLAAVALGFLWRARGWQNEVRALMDLPPLEGAQPLLVLGLALAVFAVLWLAGRLTGALVRLLARAIGRVAPPRLAAVLGTALGLALVWTLANGVLVQGALSALDRVYRALDLRIADDLAPPASPLRTGSAASPVAWETLGRMGREMVATGPSAAEIAALTGRPATEPIRVYVGVNSAPGPADRAALALAELIRTGAFDRAVLVINTPTGTGWIDPESQTPLEYLHHGDVATVAVQYSHLASWIALLADYNAGDETARAVFDAVYGHWRSLPRDRRPRLYLHGLSLGAYFSDRSADLFKVIGDPHDGAFWAGPPFASRTWAEVTRARAPGSPEWLPRFRDGALVRFTAQQNRLDDPGLAPWGPLRLVYLQYASDAITFFRSDAWRRRPDWMAAPRGPDVAASLIWVPVVTQLQLGVDLMTSTTTPFGFGHNYLAAHYIDGWVAVSRPEGWTPESLARLKAHLAMPPAEGK
jgi:uncharacterized membrane protein